MIKRLLLFLILNFSALAIGGLFTGEGVPSDWYIGLNKAPWTPPGWVFGTAWTTIMVCFAIFMANITKTPDQRRTAALLYTVQWVLNVAWNPVFFYFNQVFSGLLIITFLSILVWWIMIHYRAQVGMRVLWVLPYGVWLVIATSLNAYIYIYN